MRTWINMKPDITIRVMFLSIFAHHLLSNHCIRCNFLMIEKQSTLIDENILTLSVSTTVSEPPTTLLLAVYLDSSIGKEQKLITKRHILPKDENITLSFQLSNRIVYFDSRNTEDETDYFAKNLRVHACIFDKVFRACVLNDEIYIPLFAPWNRKEIPTYEPTWAFKMKLLKRQRFIPFCIDIADTIDFTTAQLAISGKHEQGFMKKVLPLKWPVHVPARVKESILSNTRFTLSSWIYILDSCPHDYCEIASHRLSLKFLSPVILLNRAGFIHVQVHDSYGTGEAFVTNSPVPFKQWLHIVLTVNDNEVQISVADSEVKGGYHRYLHRFKEIAFESDAGIWNIGGYFGFPGIRGIICCVRLHRRKALHPDQLSDDRKDREMVQQFDVPKVARRCSSIQRKFYSLWKKYVYEPSTCTAAKLKDIFPLEKVRAAYSRRRIRISEDVKEAFDLMENYFKNKKIADLHDRKLVAKRFNILGISKMTTSTKVATLLLDISGCLGYMESFLSASLASYFDKNQALDPKHVIAKQLYAAMHGDELSQLALSYKHQIGLEEIPQDINIAAGYAKAAALKVKKIMENEEQYIHTHSEMIRLDEAHLFAGKRGLSSDVIKWLRRQADWGSLNAQSQMAEILFHGQHGMDAHRNEAVNLYRAGALQGDANSMYNLGVLHLRGIEVEKNETKAIDLFQQAAEKNFTIAYNSLGYHELVNRNNISGALHFWTLASNMGDKDAMTNLGIQYENGIAGLLEPNKTMAFKLFRKSAEQGQKDGCIKFADYLVTGIAGDFDSLLAIRFYRHVAEQSPTIGLYLRNAFDSYMEGQWDTSLAMYMIVSETGLALSSFNTALLCDEMLRHRMNVGTLGSNCSLHFYNISASLGWPTAIIHMGDEYWYGERVPMNRTKAAINYAWIAKHQNSPQALFNLGFIIENSFSVEGIDFGGENVSKTIQGNATLAKVYYERCQRSPLDNGDGYYPCTIALMNLKFKALIQESKARMVFVGLAFVACLLVVIFSSDEI